MGMGCRLSVCVWDAIRSTPDEGISLLAEGRNGMTGLWPHQEDRRLRFFCYLRGAKRHGCESRCLCAARKGHQSLE